MARCDTAYEGVRHRRFLCLTPSYVLVLDDLAADRPRQFDWLFHHRGLSAESDAANGQEPGELSFPGWEYVQNVRFGVCDGPVRVRFLDRDLTTHLTMAATPGTEVRIADGVGQSVVDRVPLAMVSRRGDRVQLAALLEPVPEGQAFATPSLSVQQEQGVIRMVVERDGTRDEVTLNDQDQVQVRRGGRLVLASESDTGSPSS